jgi:mRNA interferase RelE/StbE
MSRNRSRNRNRGGPAPGPEPSRYEIVLTRAAERGLSALSRSDLRKVDARIRALADDPRPPGSKKLAGGNDLYRVRSGEFRVLYQVEDARRVVTVVDVGNRRDIDRSL